ncbi:cytochrome P450 7B1 [Ornithorhynchus anatinus]|uniref:25/26-hydroxycholesterol 7alpha-hydroxylase n=1 Tax=Ornithorhynchus anatinus TaxID=9258 RepID=F6Q7Y4_ORNAN|nr:cytochrome P450 7B1 [Ornithorhynchus anatinus]
MAAPPPSPSSSSSSSSSSSFFSSSSSSSSGPALATVTALLVLAVWLVGGRTRRPKEPPLVPSWIPFLGRALQFKNDPYHFLKAQQKIHGDVFTVLFVGKYITFILDPFQFPTITRTSKHFDFKGFANHLGQKIFNYQSLYTIPNLSKDIHESFRYLQGKPLDKLVSQVMHSLQCIFKEKFSRMADWETEQMYTFCHAVIFEATFTTFYGKYPTADGHKVINEIRETFAKFDANFPKLAANIPIELLGSTKKNREFLIRQFTPELMVKRQPLAEIIQFRREFLEKYKLLQDYSKAAHHFGFLWASVGNTIPASFWALYYLLRHPEALAVVRDEIDHLLQSTGQANRPGSFIYLTREQLDNLVYLDSLILESFRLNSASTNFRIIQEDFTLQLEDGRDFNLRKGDWLALFPQTMHRDPEIFEDPEVFKFDRFVENGKKKTTFFKRGRKLKYFLMPFGSGVSMCPGRFFAVSEIKQFLILLLVHLEAEIIEEKNLVSNNERLGFGILYPNSDISFRYRWKGCGSSLVC